MVQGGKCTFFWGALVVNPVVQTIVGFGFTCAALVLFIKAAMATRDTRPITRGNFVSLQSCWFALRSGCLRLRRRPVLAAAPTGLTDCL